jgi:hypothetical protein
MARHAHGRRRAGVAALLAVGLTLAFAGAAAADREQIRLTPAGQAAARAAVLTRADMGPAAGWTGGAKKPSPSSTPPCPGFRPKQSDLVRIGAAKTEWKHAGLAFASEAQVLETPAMVRLDWQRTVLAPQILPCLRAVLSKQTAASTRFVSVRWLPVPRLSTYTRALRVMLEVKTATATVPVLVDTMIVGRGRTEITLTTTAPAAAAATVQAAELRLARLLVARIRA